MHFKQIGIRWTEMLAFTPDMKKYTAIMVYGSICFRTKKYRPYSWTSIYLTEMLAFMLERQNIINILLVWNKPGTNACICISQTKINNIWIESAFPSSNVSIRTWCMTFSINHKYIASIRIPKQHSLSLKKNTESQGQYSILRMKKCTFVKY